MLKAIINCGIVLFLFNIAFAGINVSPLSIYIKPNKGYALINVVNNSTKDPAYVATSVRRMDNTSDAEDKGVYYKNPKKLGLIASPVKMVLNPGTSRKVKVTSLQKPGNKEIVYNVFISQKKGQVISTTKKLKKGNSTIILTVNTAYISRVMVLPKKPFIKVNLKRSGRNLVVKNNGNVNFLIYQGKQCVDKCTKLNLLKRVYPGQTWNTKLTFSAPVELNIRDYSGEIIKKSN